MIFYYTEIVKDNLDITNVIGGQFVFCTDTFDVFYDRDLETRIQIDQGDVFFLNTDEDREAILNPLKNKIYYVKSTNTPYRYNGAWFKITDNDMIMQVVFDNDEYVPVNFATGNKQVAVNTLASQVYTTPNFTAQDEVSQLTLLKVENRYAYAARENQMEFEIPFPIKPYNFYRDKMNVVLRNQVISENKYTIQDDMLVFNDNYYHITPGESILFTFYYNVYIDLNAGVKLESKNIGEGTITEDKIAPNAVSYNKLSDELKTKLGVISSDDGVTKVSIAEKLSGRTSNSSKYEICGDKLSNALDVTLIPSNNLSDAEMYIRQMEYDSNQSKRMIKLIDADGNTSFPGKVSAKSLYVSGNEVYHPNNLPTACQIGGGEIIELCKYRFASNKIYGVQSYKNSKNVHTFGKYIKFDSIKGGNYLVQIMVPNIYIKPGDLITCKAEILYNGVTSYATYIINQRIYNSPASNLKINIAGTYSDVFSIGPGGSLFLSGNINFSDDSPVLIQIIKIN